MSCAFHVDARYCAHETAEGHPEYGDRIRNLLLLKDILGDSGVPLLESERCVTEAELLRVHTRNHVDSIRGTAGAVRTVLDPDTSTSALSHETALYAAGAALEAVDRVMKDDFLRAFVALRPPGHHAESDRAMGFCLYNNVAVAARHLIEQHHLSRVLIVDWDVHHGNGTQEIFYHDDRVFFISLHQHPLYPGTGAASETGAGPGQGFTLNLPLPAGCGDDEYAAAFQRYVVPAAEEFAPQFVLVSAGFDAHARDPLGGMRVSEDGFANMAASVCEIADRFSSGRVVAVLEGGYDVEALRASVESVVHELNADS